MRVINLTVSISREPTRILTRSPSYNSINFTFNHWLRIYEEVSRRWIYHNKKEGDCSPSFQCSVIQLLFVVGSHDNLQDSCKICMIEFVHEITIVAEVIDELME